MRETKTVDTPVSKQKIELLTYITGRDKRALTGVFLDGGMNIDPVTQRPDGITADIINRAQDLAIKTVIISIDGKKDGEIDLVGIVLDMQRDDFDFVISEINKVTGDDKFEKKNQS